jgi:hypothetical protein
LSPVHRLQAKLTINEAGGEELDRTTVEPVRGKNAVKREAYAID